MVLLERKPRWKRSRWNQIELSRQRHDLGQHSRMRQQDRPSVVSRDTNKRRGGHD
jgi:hypothetical protein